MIVLTRVDYRLIHGQVAMAWTRAVSADCILVASDAVANDDLRKAALRMAKPSGVKLVIKSIDDAATALNAGVTEKYRLMVLVESIEDAYRLARASDRIASINLGATPPNEDADRKVSTAIFASSHDVSLLQQLADGGVEVEIRQIPTDAKLPLNNAL